MPPLLQLDRRIGESRKGCEHNKGYEGVVKNEYMSMDNDAVGWHALIQR